jgi:hypothetical protein
MPANGGNRPGGMMGQPDQDTTEVLVIVAMPPVETRVSEEAVEQDIVNAVSAAVYGDKTLDTIAVRPLEYEDCQWIFEGGMPMPDYDVTVGQDGSWHSGIELYRSEYEASGQDLQSLFDYLVEKGRIKK